MPPVLETEHLELDYLDRVWLAREKGEEGDPLLLGYIDNDPDWPAAWGAEPTWYLTELGLLHDQFADLYRYSLACRAEDRATYDRGRFA